MEDGRELEGQRGVKGRETRVATRSESERNLVLNSDPTWVAPLFLPFTHRIHWRDTSTTTRNEYALHYYVNENFGC